MRETRVATIFTKGLICLQAGLVLFAVAAVVVRQPQLWNAEAVAQTIVAAHAPVAVFER